MSQPGVLLLAAGKASRFGSDKLLNPITIDGVRLPVIAHTLNRYQRLGLPLHVVSHSFHTALHDFLADYKVENLICPYAHQGMGHSLAYGVRHQQDQQGWLIGLADMPYVQTATLQKIVQAISEKPSCEKIIRPVYKDHLAAAHKTPLHIAADKMSLQNNLGHPVYFPKSFAYQLSRLEGDKGARDLIKHNWHQQFMIASDDPGILLDIDKPEDIIE